MDVGSAQQRWPNNATAEPSPRRIPTEAVANFIAGTDDLPLALWDRAVALLANRAADTRRRVAMPVAMLTR